MEEIIKELQMLDVMLNGHDYAEDSIMRMGLRDVIERLQKLQQTHVMCSGEDDLSKS